MNQAKSIHQKLYFILTRKEHRQVLVLLLFVFITTVLEIFGISLIVPVAALMSRPNLADDYPILQPVLAMLGHPSQAQLVLGALLFLVGVYVLKTFFLVTIMWYQNKFIYGMQARLASRLFSGYLKQPWVFHLQRNSAQLILNVTNEVNLLISGVLQPSILILTEGIVLLGIVGLLFVVQPLAAITVGPILALTALGFQRMVRNKVLRWGKGRQVYDESRLQHLQEGLGAVKDVKLLGREKMFMTHFEKCNLASIGVTVRQKTVLELPRLWLELLVIISLTVFVFLSLMQGHEVESLLPVLALFSVATFRLLPSVNRLLGGLQNIRYSVPVVDRLFDEVQLLKSVQASELKPGEDAASLTFEHAVEVTDLTYRYPGSDGLTLRDVSMCLPYKQTIGLIGPSGTGKSTLLDVVLGLLTPSDGSVCVDGINIQKHLRGWQDKIGYIPQTIFLTDASIRQNIAFGISEDLIDDAAVLKALKAAQLDEFIMGLPKGVHTEVGERGVRLSGGQRQRIGIARALYHDPSFLVLDEATSSLDVETEKGVMAAIRALHGHKTILIVAHRLSTVAHCDLLYRMERGTVVQSGSYAEVIAAQQKKEQVFT
jgi:ATP-binding cassette, subfamily B, bacterial PglK